MTGSLPGLRPGEPDPVQRASCDDMAASAIPWAETGNAGRDVPQTLVERGVPVRAMVRREADRGSFPAGVQFAREHAGAFTWRALAD